MARTFTHHVLAERCYRGLVAAAMTFVHGLVFACALVVLRRVRPLILAHALHNVLALLMGSACS